MAEYGGKGAKGKDGSFDGSLPLQLCLQHSCHTVCKMFLESSVMDYELKAASSYISTISEIADLLPLRPTTQHGSSSTPRSRPVTSRKGSNYEAVCSTDLQLLLVLTAFCVKIWNRDLEVVDNAGQLKSLGDYVEYFFDTLSYSDGSIIDEESRSEGSRGRRKTYIIRHLNSQRILLKNDVSVNKKEVINMFNKLNERKLVLYPKEVRKVILNPQMEVPNFLDYSSFFLAVKQIVIDILEICGSSYLGRLENIFSKSKALKNTSSSGDDLVLLHEVFDGFQDLNGKKMYASSPECQMRRASLTLQDNLPSQDKHCEIDPIANEEELPSQNRHCEIEPVAAQEEPTSQDKDCEIQTMVNEEELTSQDKHSELEPMANEEELPSQDKHCEIEPIANDEELTSQDKHCELEPIANEEELMPQDKHCEIEPIANKEELPSENEHPEYQPMANVVVHIDSTVDEEQRGHSKQKRRKFTQEEENWLRKGVKKYGVGKWKVILESYPFRNRTSVNLKDKFRNMTKNNQL